MREKAGVYDSDSSEDDEETKTMRKTAAKYAITFCFVTRVNLLVYLVVSGLY